MICQFMEIEADESMNKGPFHHTPVMPEEVVGFLRPQEGDIFVDATLGLGGHTEGLLKAMGSEGRVIGIDRDAQALKISQESLAAYGKRCIFIKDDFRHLDTILMSLGIEHINGLVLDLGVSSLQLDDANRGFSFRHDGPLDMRMDQESFISAYDLVNSLSQEEISHLLKIYGQERWHNRIAKRIVLQRHHKPIETTEELEGLILSAIPYRSQKDRSHPATRTFQALRIAVNRELEALELVLEKCINFLKPQGRVCVIAFHSLEDRIVKEKFRQFFKQGLLKILTKKPLYPKEGEIQTNPRSRSARLRVAERL